jgi:lactate dehydrogenase-like 2-hydroxyacid dehydrogenase
MTQKVPLLLLASLPAQYLEQVRAAYDVVYAPTGAARAAAVTQHGARVRAVLTIGTIGLTADEIAAMPELELVCTLGVGYEKVDLDAARARGIPVANGAGTNSPGVADHAFGLLLAAVRGIVTLDRAVRDGLFRDTLPSYTPTIFGKRLGILGFGMIGRQLARRAAGFDMQVGYYSRTRRDESGCRYFDTLLGLAEWCDYLVVAVPGGAATYHLVNAQVLKALGPRGVVVNIARGSVVDTDALADALRGGVIAAAGLDVYESEPQSPQPLVGLPNVVLTPHVAGRSPEAMQAQLDRFLENAEGHFSGRGVVSPVPMDAPA